VANDSWLVIAVSTSLCAGTPPPTAAQGSSDVALGLGLGLGLGLPVVGALGYAAFRRSLTGSNKAESVSGHLAVASQA
jgi:hypothetical protein